MTITPVIPRCAQNDKNRYDPRGGYVRQGVPLLALVVAHWQPAAAQKRRGQAWVTRRRRVTHACPLLFWVGWDRRTGEGESPGMFAVGIDEQAHSRYNRGK